MHTENDGAASGWVAAEAVAVGTVQRVVFILAVQRRAGDSAKFAQAGDGWRGRRGRLSLDLGYHLVEGRRVGMLCDGAVDVIGEVAHAAMEPGQDVEGLTAVAGCEALGCAGIDLGKGYQVSGRQTVLAHDAAEGVGEPAFSVGAEAPVPVQSSGGHSVAGRALDVGGCRADFAGGQVAVRAVEVTAAGVLVRLNGSYGVCSFTLGGWVVSWFWEAGFRFVVSIRPVGHATI